MSSEYWREAIFTQAGLPIDPTEFIGRKFIYKWSRPGVSAETAGTITGYHLNSGGLSLALSGPIPLVKYIPEKGWSCPEEGSFGGDGEFLIPVDRQKLGCHFGYRKMFSRLTGLMMHTQSSSLAGEIKFLLKELELDKHLDELESMWEWEGLQSDDRDLNTRLLRRIGWFDKQELFYDYISGNAAWPGSIDDVLSQIQTIQHRRIKFIDKINAGIRVAKKKLKPQLAEIIGWRKQCEPKADFLERIGIKNAQLRFMSNHARTLLRNDLLSYLRAKKLFYGQVMGYRKNFYFYGHTSSGVLLDQAVTLIKELRERDWVFCITVHPIIFMTMKFHEANDKVLYEKKFLKVNGLRSTQVFEIGANQEQLRVFCEERGILVLG